MSNSVFVPGHITGFFTIEVWIEILNNNKKNKDKNYYDSLNRNIISKIDNLSRDVSKVQKKNKKLKRSLNKQKKINKELKSSISWKITGPFRKTTSIFKRDK